MIANACAKAPVHASLLNGVGVSLMHNVQAASIRQGASSRWIHRTPVFAMAQPSKKAPTKTVHIYCSKCNALIYKYRKGGKGSLVKCYIERIVEDYTKEGELSCPECGTEFARPARIRGRPANKIIGKKVFMKG